MNTESPTPETDEATRTTDWLSGEPMVPQDFARRLERERDEARKELLSKDAQIAGLQRSLEKSHYDCRVHEDYIADCQAQIAKLQEAEEDAERLAKLVSDAIDEGPDWSISEWDKDAKQALAAHEARKSK